MYATPSVTWADVRSGLIDNFEPYSVQNIGQPAVEFWNEIVAVSSVGAWRSLASLCGQYVELLLKDALRPHIDRRALSKLMLNDAIHAAVRYKVFDEEGALPGIGGALHSARLIRNMASHPGVYRAIDERRATQSLGLMIVFSGYLFPRPTLDTGPVGTFAIDTATMRGVLKRAGNVRRLGNDDAQLARGVVSNFGAVLENSGHTRVRDLLEFARWMQDKGYGYHARTVGALLPKDTRSLEILAERSPLRFAKYVYEVQRSDPQLFMDRSRFRFLRSMVSRQLDSETSSISVAASLTSVLDSRTRAEVLTETADRWLNRLQKEPIGTGIALLPLVARAPTLDLAVKKTLVEGIEGRIATSSDAELSPVMLRLSHLNCIDTPEADSVIRQLLSRAVTTMSLHDQQRVLWDCYALSSRHGERAASLSEEVGSRLADTTWDHLLLYSIGYAAGRRFGPRLNLVDAASLPWPEGPADRFQQLRVALVLVLAGVRLPKDRRAALHELAEDTRGGRSATTASRLFLSRCREVL